MSKDSSLDSWYKLRASKRLSLLQVLVLNSISLGDVYSSEIVTRLEKYSESTVHPCVRSLIEHELVIRLPRVGGEKAGKLQLTELGSSVLVSENKNMLNLLSRVKLVFTFT